MAWKKPDVWIEMEGSVERVTAKAVLFWAMGKKKPAWFPKSQFQIIEEGTNDQPAVVKATEWIIKQKTKAGEFEDE